MDLMTIDGSIGEGGGQILRTAIAMSAILQKGVRITNIRKSRPRPGLAIQHVKSIELARDMADASVKGLFTGSTEVEFIPGPIKGGDYSINMTTAGSITLALQSVLPIATYAPGPVNLDIIGGTDVKWSPPIDYFENVTLPALRLFGFSAGSSLLARGFYPVGNGHVKVHVKPASLHGIEFIEPYGDVINGVSASSRLPQHVAMRQSRAAGEYLASQGYKTGDIRTDIRNDISTGSSITLFKGFTGGSALGERGIPAEKVGLDAATKLAGELETHAAVDAHLADQLVIYMALADGRSGFSASHITDHTLTGIRLLEMMTGRAFEVVKNKVSIIRS